ncbi:hypothetical protein [Gordonia sp. SND2]|uniref:hypothetical protein n=1 Tax=Gordonia sp. SND2 TaxID=3388659 RepID=UPI00398B696A
MSGIEAPVEAQRWAAWFAAERDHVRSLRVGDLAYCEEVTVEVEKLRADVERVRKLAEHWANPTVKINGESARISPEYAARVLRRTLCGEAGHGLDGRTNYEYPQGSNTD